MTHGVLLVLPAGIPWFLAVVLAFLDGRRRFVGLLAAAGLAASLAAVVWLAFVVLREGVEGTDELEAELQQLVKKKFAAHAYPRAVHFVPHLPKTPSGKVQRFLLRQR